MALAESVKNILAQSPDAKVKDIVLRQSAELEISYLRGTSSDDHESSSDPVVILPLNASNHVSPKQLQSVIDDLSKTEGHLLERITLALVDSDATVVYYHLYTGLHSPSPQPLSVTHQQES